SVQDIFSTTGNMLMFDNIGFGFKYLQVSITGDLSQKMDFIGGEVIYRRNGTNHIIILDTDDCLKETNGYCINMDSLFFAEKGWTGFDYVQYGDSLFTYPLFRISEHMNDGTNYFHTKEVSSLVSMSGAPFTGINLKTDVLLVDQDYLLYILPDSVRGNFSYWCTAFEARPIGIGDMYSQYINFGIYNTPCHNYIYPHIRTNMGSNDIYNTNVSVTSFNYELRNFWMLDSVKFEYPSVLMPDSVTLTCEQSNIASGYNLVSQTITTDPIHWNIVDSTLTVYPASFLDNATGYIPGNLTAYDETKRYHIRMRLRMENYHAFIPEFISANNYKAYSYWSNFPGQENGYVTSNQVNHYSNFHYHFVKPLATLLHEPFIDFEPYNNTEFRCDLGIMPDNSDVPIGADGYKKAILCQADNTFIVFEEHPYMTVTGVQWDDQSTPVLPSYYIDNKPLFKLGIQSYRTDYRHLFVYADYGCTQYDTLTKDSIECYIGWNCYNYPASLEHDSVCYLDTLLIAINIPEEGIQVPQIPEVVLLETCSAVNIELQMTPTGYTIVDSLVITMQMQDNTGFYYENSTAQIVNSGLYVQSEVIDGNTVQWILIHNNLQPIQYNDVLNFTVPVVPGCNATDVFLRFDVKGYNFCGMLIDSTNVFCHLIIDYELPPPDEVSINISAEDIVNCNASDITIEVTNTGTDSTTAYDTVYVTLPEGVIYQTGGNVLSIIDNVVAFGIPADIFSGETENIVFGIASEEDTPCDLYEIYAAAHTGNVYDCAGNTCYYGSDTSVSNAFASFAVIKQQLQINNISVSGFCDTVREVTVTIENTGIQADDIFVNLYDEAGIYETLEIQSLQGGNSLDIQFIYSGSYMQEHTVYATAGGICVCAADTSEAVVIPAALIAEAGGQDVMCYGEATGIVSITVLSGTAPYVYQWSDGCTDSVCLVASGSYTVTVTDAGGCIAGTSVTITEPSASLSATTVITDVLCYGQPTGATDLTVTGGTAPYAFLWSSGQNTEDLYNVNAGYYSVTITDANDCAVTESAEISEPAELTVTVNVINISSQGASDGEASLIPQGGTPSYTYLWSTGAQTQSIAQLTEGTYSFTLTDSHGCSVADSFVIAFCEISVTTENETCPGECDGSATVLINFGTPPYTITWNDPNQQHTTTAENLCAGFYSVTVADNSGMSEIAVCEVVNDVFVQGTVIPGKTVSVNETWTGDFTVTDEIEISAYATLTLDACRIQFDGAGILVHPGGNLSIINGSILTTKNGCTGDWPGIRHEPHPDSELPTVIEIHSESQIRYALCGVEMGHYSKIIMDGQSKMLNCRIGILYPKVIIFKDSYINN
ncbi:MAG: SprB repeat-containing protein, partial [Bacteroidetes bacterium]|nr:SprB repeat-containing protein [Bacteroidota bacterium]